MIKFLFIYVAVIFYTKFVCSVSQDTYCREQHNVTFLGLDETVIEKLLANLVDPCIQFNVFDLYTMKTVPARSEGIGHFTRKYSYHKDNNDNDDGLSEDEVLSLQFLSEETKVFGDFRQTLVHYAINRNITKIEQIYDELKGLQEEQGWDLIILCSIISENFPCSSKPWINFNRIFSLHDMSVHRSFEALLKNPAFNPVQWLNMTEMENFQKSCFENQDTVISIIFYGYHMMDPLLFVQKAIAMVLHFSANNINIKFRFHLTNSNVNLNMGFLNNYLTFYGISNNTILFNNRKHQMNVHGIRDIINFVENGRSNDKTKNVFLVVFLNFYMDSLCESKGRLNDILTAHLMEH